MIILRHARRLTAFVLLQVILIVALLEIVGRVFNPLGISYYPETARYLDTLILEEPIGYRNRPGLQDTFYGVPVSINALGLRDREVGEKPPGEFRILVMGDSVPFGIGVRYEDSYPYQMEVLLNERAAGRRFRTLNMGVPSYNTEQELVQLKSLGLSLKPDVVTLLFSDNDIEPKLWVFNKRHKWYVNLVQRSYAGSLLFVLFRETRLRLGELVMPPAYADDPVLDNSGVAYGEYRTDSPRWQAIDHSLTEINSVLRQRNIPFVLFTNNERSFIVELLEGVARREGFPLVNLRRHEDPRWAGKDERLFHNSVVDAHPTPLGNLALATLIAENLRIRKVLGPR